jgi:hypothetical protein
VAIWKGFRAGAGSALGAGILAGWCLSQRGGAPVVPHGAGAQQGLMGGGSLRGGGPVSPCVAGAQQGLKGSGLVGAVSQQAVGPAPGCGQAGTSGGDPGGRESSGAAEGLISQHGVSWMLAWLRGRCPGGVWIQCSRRGVDPTMHGSGSGLWPGAAVGWRAQQNGAAALQTYGAGIWQAGFFFIR